MCVKDLAQASGVLPNGDSTEGGDEYKNPGSGVSTPQWKLGVNINDTASTQGSSSQTSESEMTRSEISG